MGERPKLAAASHQRWLSHHRVLSPEPGPAQFRALARVLVATLCLLGLLSPARAWDTTFAYQAWWMPQAWKTAPVDGIDRLLFFDLPVEVDGSIRQTRGWPQQWQGMLEELQRGGPPTDLVLTILDAKRFDAVFTSDDATARLLAQSTALLADGKAKGLHLDFEVYTEIHPDVLARFRGFVAALRRNLKAQQPSHVLSVFVPMGGVTAMYDGPLLQSMDWVIVQGYDAHWAGGPSAGPLSPLDGDYHLTWTKIVQQVAAWGLSRRKVLISYPLFGYEWQTLQAKPLAATAKGGITTTLRWVDPAYLPDLRVNVNERVGVHGTSNDELSGSAYYRFTHQGKPHVGWYEGIWSMQRKREFLQNNLLGGVAFFVLGYDNHSLLRDHALARHQQSPAAKAARHLSFGPR